ncbi:MAG TPA: ROK family transcriptional regulator [Verrucomicrobiae bacterium]|nr:ROK family transcriptional regulator [Verrucomicrobiae bacterium]
MHKINLNNFQAATTRTARDINRRVVLNLIRKHQPISRAEVARRARLQRSTVSAITEQLIAERWVTTGASGNLPRGRKPTLIHFNGSRAGIIGIDLRPAETKMVLADLEMRFLAQETIATDRDAGRFIPVLCDRVCRLVKSHPQITCEGIGVALPGRIDPSSSRLVFAPNLRWAAVDLRGPLSRATGLSVELENAANACALAEIWSEVYPESVRNLVAITISEGVGVGMVLNGQLVRGTTGWAGEFGHIVIQENGPLCNCGQRGCLEAFASNTAAVRYFREIASQRNAGPAQPGFDSILRMAEEGDRNAGDSLNRMAHYLGICVAIITTGLAPDVIVLVGEVTRVWKQIRPVITAVVKERSVVSARPRIIPAGPETRLRGAVALVTQRHFGALHSF